MGKIKQPELKSGKNIQKPQEISIMDYKHPIFCFRYLHKDYGLTPCETGEKVSLIDQTARLSQLTWDEIKLANKLGLGSEKIAIGAIRPSKPDIITSEVGFLLAFRFQGLKLFAGHRNRFVFHIIYIDRAFEVYPR